MRRDGLSDRRASFGSKCAQPERLPAAKSGKASAVLRPLRYPNAMRTAFDVAARRRSPRGAPQSGQVPSVLLRIPCQAHFSYHSSHQNFLNRVGDRSV